MGLGLERQEGGRGDEPGDGWALYVPHLALCGAAGSGAAAATGFFLGSAGGGDCAVAAGGEGRSYVLSPVVVE